MGEKYSSATMGEIVKEQLTLVDLPNETLFQIFSELPKDALFWNVGLTCQKFFVITRDILEHQVHLGSNSTSFDVLHSRINILLRYKEILSSIGSFSIDSDDSYTFRDNLKVVLNTGTRQNLNIVCTKKLRIEDATIACQVLKRCNSLKGIYINKEYFDRNNDVSVNQVSLWFSILGSIKLEFLSLIGFKEQDVICDTIVNNWNSSITYLNINRCRFSRHIIVRTLASCSKLEHVVLYNILEIDKDIENELTNISVIECGIISPYWRERALNLREQFCKYGSCGRELSEDQARASLRFDNVSDIPEPLMALLMAAREWHSIR